jgi:hypothetical protein
MPSSFNLRLAATLAVAAGVRLSASCGQGASGEVHIPPIQGKVLPRSKTSASEGRQWRARCDKANPLCAKNTY